MNNTDDFGWGQDLAPANAQPAKPVNAGGDGPRGNAPTEKRLAFARTLMSERPGVVAPDGFEHDWKICSAFIEQMLKTPGAGKNGAANGGAGLPPTDKQIAFATKLLGERPGFQEPSGWRNDRKACSAFIDSMLGQKGGRKKSSDKKPAVSGDAEDAPF